MGIPCSVGQLQDDAIAEVIHLPQPEIVHNVITIHERLQEGSGEKKNNYGQRLPYFLDYRYGKINK